MCVYGWDGLDTMVSYMVMWKVRTGRYRFCSVFSGIAR
jgi:hypothetical protein